MRQERTHLERIEKYLAIYGSLTTRDLSRCLKTSKQGVRQALDKLMDRGIVERIPGRDPRKPEYTMSNAARMSRAWRKLITARRYTPGMLADI